MPLDIGKFVGRYLQVLAGLSLAAMFAALARGVVQLDFTFILLFWAGSSLVRHRPLARRLVIAASAAIVGAALTVFLVLGRFPLDGITVSILGVPVSDPSPSVGASLGIGLFLAAAVPLVLLLTPRARSEFGSA